MKARKRLQGAFGTYVDPVLAARLLEQGDDVFTGERREVTVMFVDIRDFTPFAEANTAEDTVARLNALFEIVVPAVVEAGGHVNKFLWDGALAVFGGPNDLADHADAAVTAAVLIHRLVAERFGGTLRMGIGINTGVVIAGTIGGGGKLEFTLIGDAVNVAARVEQLTKTTGDAILITQPSVDALAARPPTLTDRGSHALKGKSAAVRVEAKDIGHALQDRLLPVFKHHYANFIDDVPGQKTAGTPATYVLAAGYAGDVPFIVDLDPNGLIGHYEEVGFQAVGSGAAMAQQAHALLGHFRMTERDVDYGVVAALRVLDAL